MNSIDIQYSKPRKNISLTGAFNACVIVPFRFLGGVIAMASPAGIIVNNGLMGEMPLDRLERDLFNADPKTSFKIEKTGLLGRGLTIKAEESHPYGPIKTVRHCNITFDSRAERNHYAQQINDAGKKHSGLFLSAYTDIATSVLNGSLNLDMNTMMKRFDTGNEKKGGILSRVFGRTSAAEKEHKHMMKQHRKNMHRMGIKSAL